MKRPVLIAVLSLFLSATVNADWLEGQWYWPTMFGRDSLTFRTNDNLIYESVHTMKGETKSYRLFGKWELKNGICRSGDEHEVDENTTVEGNLMLHIDTAQCCLQAAQSGDQLALKKVWVKGSGLAIHAYCSDNLLTISEPS